MPTNADHLTVGLPVGDFVLVGGFDELVVGVDDGGSDVVGADVVGGSVAGVDGVGEGVGDGLGEVDRSCPSVISCLPGSAKTGMPVR